MNYGWLILLQPTAPKSWSLMLSWSRQGPKLKHRSSAHWAMDICVHMHGSIKSPWGASLKFCLDGLGIKTEIKLCQGNHPNEAAKFSLRGNTVPLKKMYGPHIFVLEVQYSHANWIRIMGLPFLDQSWVHEDQTKAVAAQAKIPWPSSYQRIGPPNFGFNCLHSSTNTYYRYLPTMGFLQANHFMTCFRTHPQPYIGTVKMVSSKSYTWEWDAAGLKI